MGLVPEPQAQVHATPIKVVPNRGIYRKTAVEVKAQANFIAIQIIF